MIKLKNQGELLVDTLSVPGTQTTSAVAKTVYIVPFACQLKSLFARLGTAGITGSQNVDIKKNGTSIFAAGGIAFATTAVIPTYGALTAGNKPAVQFAKGDVIGVYVTTIHSGTAAIDLALSLVLQRLKGTGPVAAMLTDTIGPEAE